MRFARACVGVSEVVAGEFAKGVGSSLAGGAVIFGSGRWGGGSEGGEKMFSVFWVE